MYTGVEQKWIVVTKTKQRLKFTCGKKNKKLQSKDEFLLALMRLPLGLSNYDLADRLCISSTHCSNIFKTWIFDLFVKLKTVEKLVACLPK